VKSNKDRNQKLLKRLQAWDQVSRQKEGVKISVTMQFGISLGWTRWALAVKVESGFPSSQTGLYMEYAVHFPVRPLDATSGMGTCLHCNLASTYQLHISPFLIPVTGLPKWRPMCGLNDQAQIILFSHAITKLCALAFLSQVSIFLKRLPVRTHSHWHFDIIYGILICDAFRLKLLGVHFKHCKGGFEELFN
jgi:hypothetical protein